MAETNEFELSLADLTRLSKSIRTLGAHASSREEVAQRIASFLHDGFRDPDSGERCCALVRLFHTQRFGNLPRSLRDAALRTCGQDQLADDVRCLTLIGTAGDHPDWASRRTSRGHQAIPLVSEAAIARLPMIYQLLVQLGIDPVAVAASDRELMLDLERRTSTSSSYRRRAAVASSRHRASSSSPSTYARSSATAVCFRTAR